MADFYSKRTGEQIEALLDIVSQGGGGGGEGGTITEAEITAMGFTKNLGTITEVKMNGVSKGTDGVVDLGNVITEHQDISGKQDEIEDLDDIRSGAALGATALQSVPSEYVTESELSAKGYATTSALNGKVDKVSGKGLSTEDFTTALKTKLEGLNNYDDSEIEDAVSSLQTQLNTLVSGNANDAINSFNEIIAFLDGVKDTQDLASIIASIEQQIASKMDKVTLAAVATSGSYNDLSDVPWEVSNAIETGYNVNVDGELYASQLKTSGIFLFDQDTLDWSSGNSGQVPIADGEGNVMWGNAANTKPDWIENNTASDSYIKNRTHYVDGTKISAAGVYSIGLNTPIYYREKVYNLEVGVRTQIDTNAAGVYVTLHEGGILNVEDGARLLTAFPIIAISKIAPLDDIFIPEHIVREENLKTINGQSLVGSGDITISGGGGDDIRYFTDFTVEEVKFAAPIGVNISYDATAVIDAVRNNKLICVPYANEEKGYAIASYKFTDGEGYGLRLYATLFDDGANYRFFVAYSGPYDGSYYMVRGNGVTIFSTQYQDVEVVDGEATVYVSDNALFFVTDVVEMLYLYLEDLVFGSTIRFMSGENTTIDFLGYWANGVIPTIEPYTVYEMSIAIGMDYTPCAVLTPFKPIE